MLSDRTLGDLSAGRYAFIDAGCASGASIDHCQRRFGIGRGLGLDWYGQDLSVARAEGLDAEHCDLVTQPLPHGCVAFASMVDFLEHLSDIETAARVIEKCAAAARDFLFIRHPSFEDADYLARFDLKLGWTAWESHTNPMRLADFRTIFNAAGWTDVIVIPGLPICDAAHPAVVPLSAPREAHQYDAAAHGPKPAVVFDHVVYGKFDIFVRLNPALSDTDWRRMASIDGWQPIYTG